MALTLSTTRRSSATLPSPDRLVSFSGLTVPGTWRQIVTADVKRGASAARPAVLFSAA